MLKQDVPLRTGWFGYRKLDVENCIAHIRAAYAAELRLARQTQQGMEETMAQLRQENKALRQRFVQQAAAQRALSAHGSNAPRLPDGQFVQRHIRFPHCSKCKMLA